MAPKKIAGRELVTVYLGLGSNLGKRHNNLSKAVELLSPRVNIEVISSFYETDPVGYLEQPRFLNAVLKGITSLSPWMLLAEAKEIERVLGRVPSFPNAPRPIDIDILFYGDIIINSSNLTVPHPHLEERAFMLVPLTEIAPDLVHPVSGSKVKELLEKVDGFEGVKRWKQEDRDV